MQYKRPPDSKIVTRKKTSVQFDPIQAFIVIATAQSGFNQIQSLKAIDHKANRKLEMKSASARLCGTEPSRKTNPRLVLKLANDGHRWHLAEKDEMRGSVGVMYKVKSSRMRVGVGANSIDERKKISHKPTLEMIYRRTFCSPRSDVDTRNAGSIFSD